MKGALHLIESDRFRRLLPIVTGAIALAVLLFALLPAGRTVPSPHQLATTVDPAPTVPVTFYLERGHAAYLAGQYDAARQDYDLVLQLSPENAEAHLRRGDVFDELGQFEQALADYNAALELDPTYTDAYLNRALLQMKQGEIRAALADYERASASDPRNAAAFYGQAYAFQELDDCEGALRSYNQALELDPDYGEAYYGRGRIYFYCYQDDDRAIADYSAAIRLQPNPANAYFGRALAQQRQGNITEAQADFEQYLVLGDDPALRAQAERALARFAP